MTADLARVRVAVALEPLLAQARGKLLKLVISEVCEFLHVTFISVTGACGLIGGRVS